MGWRLRGASCARVVLALVIGTTVAAPAEAAPPPTPFEIENCSNNTLPGHDITAPGNYVLTRAVRNCLGNPAIMISSSDVTLDLHGVLIDGPDSATTPGVVLSGDLTGVEVRNGTITDYTSGLVLSGTGNKATTLVLRSNVRGINTIAGSSGAVISRNTVVGNTDMGILTSSGSGGHRIVGNTVARNGTVGIQTTSGSNNRYEDNLIAGNAGAGIGVFQSGTNNTFVHNTIVGNGGAGIYSQPGMTSGSTFRENTVTGNSGRGIDAGSSNVISRNRVRGNGSEGIVADNNGNRITHNVASGNLANGIFIDTPGASTKIAENTVIGNGLKGINASPFMGAGKKTNKARSNGTGNTGVGTGPFECIPADLCVVVVPRSIREGKVKPVQIDCSADPGLLIDAPGRYLLTRAKVDCDADPAVLIDASDVSFSLGGAIVEHSFGGGAPGIQVAAGRKHVTVKNGVVSDYEYGVSLDGAASRVAGIIAYRNGFGISAAAGTTIEKNTVARTFNNGIVVGEDSKVTRNTVVGNATNGAQGGIRASGSVIHRNRVIGNSRSGIYAGQEDDVRNNSVIGNQNMGIGIGSDSVVASNRVIGNGGTGILAFNPDVTVKENIVRSNGGEPTFGTNGIGSTSERIRIIDNDVRASNASGIFIDTPIESTVIKKNRADGNGILGINADPFIGAGLGTNTAKRNADPAECAPTTLC